MDMTAHTDEHAALQDAQKQRYFLPQSDENMASQSKSHVLPSPILHHDDINVADLLAAVILDKSTAPAILKANVVDVRRGDPTMPSAEPVLVASPTTSDPKALTPASPEPSTKASALPLKAILERAADLTVNDARGQTIPFKELYRAEPGRKRRVMIIFIRHFFCGVSPRRLSQAI